MFRVLGYVIFTILGKLFCIEHLCFFQNKLSRHKKNAAQGLMICLGLNHLIFCESHTLSRFCKVTTVYSDLDITEQNCFILSL